MIRRASLFSQLVALFNRGQFYHLVFKHKAEQYAKGFNSWDHFVAMLFFQLAQAKSLREICGGLSCCLGKLRHLKVVKAPVFPGRPIPFINFNFFLDNEIIFIISFV